MCKILDEALPVIGAVVGSFIAPGLGTAIGAGLGGMAGNFAQTHNFGDALGAGAMAGLTSYAGGSLSGALGGLGGDSVGATSGAFDTGLASNVSPGTLGGLETQTGGAGLFGASSGTGTAIGGAANGLGGGGLGVAGGGALSGISDNPTFLGALGGGSQGTGLGMGGAGQSTADLAGIMNGANGTPAAAGTTDATGMASNSPVSNMSNMQAGQGVTNTPTGGASTNPTSPMGSNVLDNSQAAQMGGGAQPGGTMEGAQAAPMPGGQQGALSAMYGPDSTAPGSPMGQQIANTSNMVPGAGGVQAGALGEASPTGGSMDLSSLFGGGQGGGGYNITPGENGGFNINQLGQLNPILGLAKAGYGAYQQEAQQRAYNDYVNSINSEFSPNSPYSQQMQQTLARQDAAAGRNSQGGTRAVQLAAALTQAKANALGNANYAHAATATPGASVLNSLFSMFANPQYSKGLNQLGSSAFNGLSSLFGGG